MGASDWTITILFKAPSTVSTLTLFKMTDGTNAKNFDIVLTSTTTITITIEDAVHAKNNVTLGTDWNHLTCRV